MLQGVIGIDELIEILLCKKECNCQLLWKMNDDILLRVIRLAWSKAVGINWGHIGLCW